MDIGTIASKKACTGVDNTINTGKRGCLSLFGTPAHLLAYPLDHIISATDTFNDAYLRPLIQAGIIIPLIDANAFEELSSEDSYFTNTRGVKRLDIDGLPEYKLMFEEGHEFYRQMDKLKSYKSYGFLIGDRDGNWIIGRRSDGDFTPMRAGHVTPELTKRKVEGGDPESKSLVVQFTDRLQWDRNYDILHAEELDITPLEIPTINGLNMSFNAVPANTDTDILVNAVLSQDNSTAFTGLTDSDFVVTVAGATANITGVVETTDGNYTITLDTAVTTGQVVTVQTWHGGTNTFVADSNGILVRSEAISETTV